MQNQPAWLKSDIGRFARCEMAISRRSKMLFKRNAVQAGKGAVAPEANGDGFFRGVFCPGVAGDGRMGLFSRLHLFEIRGLVFITSRSDWFRGGLLAKELCDKNFSVRNHDVVTTEGWNLSGATTERLPCLLYSFCG
jgi:hypothetical protein